MLVSLGALVALAAVTQAAFGVGRPLLRLLRVDARDPLTTAAWSVAAGLIACGHALLWLGACGLLKAEVITAATTVAAGLGTLQTLFAWAQAAERRAENSDCQDEIQDGATDQDERAAGYWIMLGAAVVAGTILLAASLAPPTSADAIAQLELPKRWLVAGRVALPASDSASDWLLPRAWSLWGLALGGGEGARMVGCLLGALLAASAAVWATPFLGRRAAWAAAALVLLSPGVMQQVVLLHPAVPAIAFGLLATAAWRYAREERQAAGWAIAAGIAIGSAMGGAGLPAALMFVLLALTHGPSRARPDGDDTLAAHPLLFAAAALAAIVNLLPHWLLPRDVQVCNTVPDPWPVGGVTILMVVLLPGLLWAGLPERLRAAWVAVPAYILFTLPLMSRREVHLVLLPLLATAAVWVVKESWRLPVGPRRVVLASLALGAAATLAVPLVPLAGPLAAVWTDDARDDYLGAREPLWPAAVVANCVLPPESHLLSQANGTFHFDRRVTTAASLGAWLDGQTDHGGPPRWPAGLRSAGFTHVLLVDPVVSDHDALTLIEYARLDATGRPHRYRLVKLP